jgi:hypothetical protein
MEDRELAVFVLPQAIEDLSDFAFHAVDHFTQLHAVGGDLDSVVSATECADGASVVAVIPLVLMTQDFIKGNNLAASCQVLHATPCPFGG